MSEPDLKARITAAMKDAMRAKQKDRLSAIRLVLSEIKRIEVDERITLSDDRVLTLLDKMMKQRRDSIKQFEQAQRQDLAEQEKFELTVIQEFLPAALGEAEINALISDAIEQSGAQSMKDMGLVMGILKPKLQGRADVGAVSKLIKSRLSSQ
jgi:hypothetical protein